MRETPEQEGAEVVDAAVGSLMPAHERIRHAIVIEENERAEAMFLETVRLLRQNLDAARRNLDDLQYGTRRPR